MEKQSEKEKRAAWAAEKSKEIGLPVLTRDDIGNLKTGVIPKEEKKWFDAARL